MNRRQTFVLIFLLILPVPAVFAMTPEEVRALVERVDGNSAPLQYESDLAIRNYGPGGSLTEQQAHVLRKGDKVLIAIIAPAIQRGQAVIRNEDDMWMYLPNSGKVLRIGAKEQSMGGEASNTDLLRVDLAKDYVGAYVGEENMDGVRCYELDLRAKDRTIAYDRVVYWVSKDKELPVKREFYSLSGRLLKTMYFRDLKSYQGRTRPSFILIQNEKNPLYKTEITLMDMIEVTRLQDFMFTPSYAQRGIFGNR